MSFYVELKKFCQRNDQKIHVWLRKKGCVFQDILFAIYQSIYYGQYSKNSYNKTAALLSHLDFQQSFLRILWH